MEISKSYDENIFKEIQPKLNFNINYKLLTKNYKLVKSGKWQVTSLMRKLLREFLKHIFKRISWKFSP